MKLPMKFILLTGVVCFTIGIVGLVNILKDTNFDEGLAMIDIEKKIAAADISKLSIQSDIAAIQFIPGTGDEIKVHMTGAVTKKQETEAKLEVNQIGNTWNVDASTFGKKINSGISLDEIKRWFAQGDKKLRVEVTLPAKALEEIRVKTNIGSIDLGEVQADSLDVQADTGRITLNSFQGRKVSLETDTGSISVLSAQGDVRLKTDTGSITATLDEVKNSVDAQSDTGRIELILAKKLSSAAFDLSTDLGRVELDVPEAQIVEKSRNMIKAKIGTGETKIKAKTDTGSVTVSSAF